MGKMDLDIQKAFIGVILDQYKKYVSNLRAEFNLVDDPNTIDPDKALEFRSRLERKTLAVIELSDLIFSNADPKKVTAVSPEAWPQVTFLQDPSLSNEQIIQLLMKRVEL